MKQKPLSPRELFILGMAARGRTYGHRIARNLRVSRADLWLSLGEKHLYYILAKLERNGLVEVFEERVGSRPPRKVIELTDSGRNVLRENLLQPPTINALGLSDFDPTFSMLAYSDLLDSEETLEVLEKRRVALGRRLDEDYPEVPAEVFTAQFGRGLHAMYDKGRRLLLTEIEWLDELIACVEQDGWDAMRIPENYEEMWEDGP